MAWNWLPRSGETASAESSRSFDAGASLVVKPIVLILSLSLLSSCGSSSATDASADMSNGKSKVASGKGGGSSSGSTTTTTTTSTTPIGTTVSVTYDTSVGVGVDSSGYASLPLRSGGHRYFVSSATGSDGNGCSGGQQAGTPLRSIAAAVTCVQGGNGDQVLVAEGTTYAEGLPNLDARAGYSAAYPTVIQSYDPSDPTNEAKYGRASNGRRPAVNTGSHSQQLTCCTTSPASYIAIRGFDFNPGNVPDMNVAFMGSNGLSNSYILVENNVFRYTTLTFQEDPNNRAKAIVVRKNSFYGAWSPTAHAQGIYLGRVASFTAEDNVLWHAGWKVGASRNDDPSVGGPTIFRHAIYQQDDADGTVRRNIFLDSSATGCSCRGNADIQQNVFIDNPISIIGGEGTDYNTAQPNGVNIDIGYNAILGDADINSANPRGAAIQTGNGKLGSAVHNNLIARSRNPNGMNVTVFNTQAMFNQPSHADIRDNVEYQWAAAPNVAVTSGTYLAQDLATYENNYWSAPASGTNFNISSYSAPNPYTAAGLFTALGCTDKVTCVAKMIETPELGWGAQVRAILWQGYGMK